MVDTPLSGDNQQGESPPTSRTRVTLPARLATTALKQPLQAAAFWSAITLPLLYLPLLAFGIDDRVQAGAFLGLLGLHAVALIVGRSYSER